MSVLSTYNPLKMIWLPGAEIAQPKGIIVIVGPNSSGKTLFLRDIEKYLLTGTPNFIVCQSLAAQRPDNYQSLVDELIAKNYLQQVPGQPNQYRTYVPFMVPRRPTNKTSVSHLRHRHSRKPTTILYPREPETIRVGLVLSASPWSHRSTSI